MAPEAEHRESDEGVGGSESEAMRVMSRILVFIDSTRPLESPCSITARVAVRWLTMLRWSFTNAGIRQRRAEPTRLSRASANSSIESLKMTRSPSLR